MKNFYDAVKERRTIHVLGSQEVISEERLDDIIKQAVNYLPTAFNGQEQRAVLLLGQNHSWFWETVTAKIKAMVPAEEFPASADRLNGFASGAGTILVYQDTAIIQHFEENFTLYKHHFATWSHQASGMLKYLLWTSLQVEGYAASLQHYTELVEEEVTAKFGLNPSWKMVGQIPFGNAESEPNPGKTFEPLENRVLTFK